MPLKTNGARIRELRERRAITQAELAERIGYDFRSVSAIEVGRKNGGLKFIRKTAEVLDCAIAEITDEVPVDRAAAS
jgi:transcriptional regulator with XRE-family HTH domain